MKPRSLEILETDNKPPVTPILNQIDAASSADWFVVTINEVHHAFALTNLTIDETPAGTQSEGWWIAAWLQTGNACFK